MRRAENDIDHEGHGHQSRIIVRIEIDPKAWEALQTVTHARGMTQLSVMSRLMDWFGQQPQMIQSGIMGHYPHSFQGEIEVMVLKEMIKRK